MTFNYEAWVEAMEANYGPHWREEMKNRGRKGGQVKTGKGIAKFSAAKRAEVSAKGLQSRWGKGEDDESQSA